MLHNSIYIKGARENNLKNIDVEIPRDKLVVVTGLSGSGKSSLAFDTIYGLNIIEAPNESGKSTLLAFLRVMLYGFPPRERGAMADKNRYAPWSLSPMRGTLTLTCEKGGITLQRDTARANSPMGRFSAVYTGSGEAVDGLTAADCGETLLGVPCEVYERSAFIRQSSLTVDASAELERRIAALITTGEEGQSFSEASAALKKQLNARKYNKSGSRARSVRNFRCTQGGEEPDDRPHPGGRSGALRRNGKTRTTQYRHADRGRP